MPTIADVAKIWLQAGVSLIPILPNGTKRPPEKWSRLMQEHPSEVDLASWFGNGHNYGLALICGRVSGRMEMLELEGRAMDSASLNKLMAIFTRDNLLDLWAMLNGPTGYSEWSPAGGLHLLYRLLDHDVPGNEKVARRHAAAEELTANPRDRYKVMAETRGEGGYVIVAPTPGDCHPSGEPWHLINGEYGHLPVLSWDQRCRLHAAIHEALDDVDSQKALSGSLAPLHVNGEGRVLAGSGTLSELASFSQPTARAVHVGREASSISPGDDFEAQVDWSDGLLLGGAGWTLESQRGHTRNWTRPGKDRHDGMSATTGRDPVRDRLYVFSSSTEFEPETPYTKFGAYAVLHHGGDHRSAARELARRGFGDPIVHINPDDFIIDPEDRATPGGKAQGADDSTVGDQPSAPTITYTLDEVGNARRLWDKVDGRFHYVWEEKEPYRYDGKRWIKDYDGALTREMITVTEDMARDAAMFESDSLKKWAKQSRTKARLKASCELMYAAVPGVTRKREEFDADRHLLNVNNGVLNLRTREFTAHDPKYLITRLFGASYRPEAQCPEFEKFIGAVLPDEKMRSYVQRALGYSLLGDADQRAMFLIYGPSGTGKSTLMETMAAVCGDYAGTAAPGAFRARGRDGGPTNDLHGLRGKRFVTTSETAQDASFDEDTLKRITGRDRVVSRELYQQNQEWTPECVLWLATNHPPKFNSDDDAIWKRAKLIPFETTFADTAAEVPDLARKLLTPEADGILNWLLAGLEDFLANGLQEPEIVRKAATQHRSQSDSVVRFVEDQEADSILIVGSGQTIRTKDLYAMYQEWCKSSGEARALGSRRFIHRLETCGRGIRYERTAGQSLWIGIGRSPSASLLGMFTA